MRIPRQEEEESGSSLGRKTVLLALGLNRPRSPKPQRSNSRTRGEASEDATPNASGVPTTFGPDTSERSRSARRQRQEETDKEPQGGEDLGEQVDFSAEDPPESEQGFQDDEVTLLYAERVDAYEERVRAEVSEIQSATARPRLLVEMPPWWATLLNYEPSGGIIRETLHDRKNWTVMEAGVREPGYATIKIPMMRAAIVEVMRDMGADNFIAAIDDQLKSGDVIEWGDPDREGAEPIVVDEVDYDMKLNYYVKLKLPTDVEEKVRKRTEEIAATQSGRRLRAKLDEAFNSYQEMYSMRTKAHEAAIRHGFPSYTQRWFERPIYRYQRAMNGLGPFFCGGGRRAGEMLDASMLNRAWMVDKLSPDG
eukprot:6475698-Amphidinium_carterae.1